MKSQQTTHQIISVANGILGKGETIRENYHPIKV